jgi:dGTPase
MITIRSDDRFARDHADLLASDLAPLVLDRQRIVHSSAFRRLQFKTQVFAPLRQDHFRTRMTHTLEVAQLARLLAQRLSADETLAEVVALAHDLGHPPFGHAGERALADCMKDHGGFEHNTHALRIVEHLEHPYPEFRGLNLTRIVRECLAKHSTTYDRPPPGAHLLHDGRPPPLEGRIAALADRLTYALHDLQDGLYAGLIDPAVLGAVELWREHERDVPTRVSIRTGGTGVSPVHARSGGTGVSPVHHWRRLLRPTIDRIQHALVTDIVEQCQTADETARSDSRPSSLRCSVASSPPSPSSPHALIPLSFEPPLRLSNPMEQRLQMLERLLHKHVYQHPKIARMDSKARWIITSVFEAYVARPELMPRRFAARVDRQGRHRVAADYLAGMTDRFLLRVHARIFDPGAE